MLLADERARYLFFGCGFGVGMTNLRFRVDSGFSHVCWDKLSGGSPDPACTRRRS
jgi:hypothetical protein